MKLISSVEKYKNSLFCVSEDRAIDPDGFEIKRAIVHHRGSAVMMAVNEKKHILLVRQYRLPARQSLWELPAGSLDEGEKPLQGAKRELKEETGCTARRWKKLVEPMRSAAREAIARVAARPDLSNDVREVVTRALAD